MAQKNRTLDLRTALRLRPLNLALGFGLAAAVEMYLLTEVASAVFAPAELGQGRLAIIAMTLLPLWVLSYVIVSLVTHRG